MKNVNKAHLLMRYILQEIEGLGDIKDKIADRELACERLRTRLIELEDTRVQIRDIKNMLKANEEILELLKSGAL